MRVPRPIIPTGNFILSIGVGAFVTLALLVAATPLPEQSYGITILLSPFLSGFFANVAYGAVERGRRHILPAGLCGFVLFYFALFFGLISGSFWELGLHRRELGILVYVSVFPPIFAIAVAIALIGGVFGWLAALAMRR